MAQLILQAKGVMGPQQYNLANGRGLFPQANTVGMQQQNRMAQPSMMNQTGEIQISKIFDIQSTQLDTESELAIKFREMTWK